MRKELKYMIYGNTIALIAILYFTFDLLTLAIDDTSKEALLDEDLNPNVEREQIIPKIIHQTYKTEDIPEHWKEGRQKCLDLHPEYEYILWTDAMTDEFIEKEYPWFLETFRNYQYGIERADAIRYFVLSHYGGVYIDLDDGCERKLDCLLTVPAFARKTSPTGISNDVMGSVPKHPFFTKLMNSLKKYDRNWRIPYITIMASTGPLFVSMVWKQYKRWGVPEGGEVRVLQPAEYKMHPQSFFSISKGSSWHLDDAQAVKGWLNHILACVVIGFVFAFFVLYTEYCLYCWLCSTNSSSSSSSSGNNKRSFNLRNLLWWKHDVEEDNLRQKRLRKDSNVPYVIFSEFEKRAHGEIV